jgi:GNAT superfamily N-acetyltransferase
VSADDEPAVTIRTAVPADLPELQRVYREASLSNAGDAPLLLARPDLLVFPGEGIARGATRVAVPPGHVRGPVLGFATVNETADGDPDLEDLFVDPRFRRRGIARLLVLDAALSVREAGHRWLWVTGNPHALAFYRAVGFVGAGPVATALGEGVRLRLDVSRPPRADPGTPRGRTRRSG